VNFPDAVLPRAPNSTRLAIANSNVPNMVGQISTCLATANLNIAELLNKSRGEYAYTLIDTDGTVGDDIVNKIRSIDGVLTARIV
jgi:D-3-phosphoglycerate dehydrogenase